MNPHYELVGNRIRCDEYESIFEQYGLLELGDGSLSVRFWASNNITLPDMSSLPAWWRFTYGQSD